MFLHVITSCCHMNFRDCFETRESSNSYEKVIIFSYKYIGTFSIHPLDPTIYYKVMLCILFNLISISYDLVAFFYHHHVDLLYSLAFPILNMFLNWHLKNFRTTKLRVPRFSRHFYAFHVRIKVTLHHCIHTHTYMYVPCMFQLWDCMYIRVFSMIKSHKKCTNFLYHFQIKKCCISDFHALLCC